MGYGSVWEHLADELALLDLRIAHLMARTRAAPAQEPIPLRGLVMSAAEAARLLRPETAENEQAAAQVRAAHAEITARLLQTDIALPLPRLTVELELHPVEQMALLAALAVEIDPKYGALFGYLADDLTRRWPSTELILDMAGLAGEQRVAARALFEPESKLLRTGLLLRREEAMPDASQPLVMDGAVVSFLTGQPILPAGAQPGPLPNLAHATAALGDVHYGMVAAWVYRSKRPTVLIHGPVGAGRRTLAATLAHTRGWPLWAVATAPDQPLQWRSLFRDAWLSGAALCLAGLEPQPGEEPPAALIAQITELARQFRVPLFFIGSGRWPRAAQAGLAQGLTVEVPLPSEQDREQLWRSLLETGPITADVDPAALAARFRYPPATIQAAYQVARTQAELRGHTAPVTQADLLAGCRAQAVHGLGPFASRLGGRSGWEALVLPPGELAQLREFCDRLRYRRQVYEEWGFAAGRQRGLGFAALFHGPSGTGKTLAAEVIANAIGIDAYRVDLSAVVSKYIGETEKNLARVFAEAEQSQALLFFDEADALFNKRVQVKDAHDRYANIEINYLLQRMEEFDGLCILATNRPDDLDEAFRRRLGFQVRFPMPDETYRRQIWQVHLPKAAPLAADVDLDFLAARLAVAGGHIRNITLGAAFLAAGEESDIAMLHLMRAARREYEKMGRHISEAEFGPYYPAVFA